MIGRISKGSSSPGRAAEAEAALAASEAALRDTLQGMPGLVLYHVGIDRSVRSWRRRA